ncbi:MAG TPA: membrane protein insertase YidC [Candidatus Angelobacter sp.]|nr:membrane protein insertase YidC [Candidatus Angelobacter sp.]
METLQAVWSEATRKEDTSLAEYRNPQNEPGSDKRMLIALVAVFVVLGVMQYFMPKPPAPPTDKTQQTQQQQQSQPSPGPRAAPLATSTPLPPKSPAATVKVPVKAATAETESVLETDAYRITFTNHGAAVKSWLLTKKEKRKDGSEKYKYPDDAGKPFELVNPLVAGQLGYPLSLFSYDKDLEKRLNDALYVVRQDSVTGALAYEYSDGGVSVRKTFRPDKDNLLNVETEVLINGQRVQALPRWSSGLGDQMAPASYTKSKVDYQQGSTIERKDPASGGFLSSKKWIVGGLTIPGPMDWAATADQYFAVAFMADDPKDMTLVTLNSQAEVPKNPAKPEEGKDKANVVGIAFGNASQPTRIRVFAGAKAVELLESVQSHPGGPDLRGVYDFGTFSFIARPLFLWLKWTYEHWIFNWGWAIAFLTVVITMALLPLRISSMKSSLRMQRIQPQMKAIQEKYKRYSLTDPRRAEMQKEMQALYKKEGVNPVGGCFPLLLQMPFLFAFYSMLNNAIELRQAGWLWVHDLSMPDPLHILPIIIIVAMFVQQKSAPQGGMDPAQQKMLAFMGPLMFGAFSWGMPAGLSIYLALSTLLGWAQQVVINRSELGQQVRKTIEKRNARKR